MSRSGLLLIVIAALALASPIPAAAQGVLEQTSPTQARTAKAAAATKACDGPVIAIACGVGGGVVGMVGDALGEAVGAGAQVAGNAAMDGLAGWVGDGAAWLVGRIARMVERSTRPELGSAWFGRQYQSMVSLALLVALGFLLVALAHAALRQDVGVALRASLIALPVAACACFAAVTLVELALVATDEATAVITARSGDDSRAFFKDVVEAVAPASASTPGMPGLLVLLGGLLVALLSIVVWIELILREAAIYLAVAFLPLSLAAMVWERTAHLVRRLVEGLAAIILAKFTIAAAVALAASAMGNARPGAGGMTALLGGCAVLILAALSPWALMRLIPLAGEQLGLHRGVVRRAAGSAPGAATATNLVRTGMRAAFSAANGPVGATAAAAAPAQQMRPAWSPTTPLRHASATPEQAARTKTPAPERRGGSDGA